MVAFRSELGGGWGAAAAAAPWEDGDPDEVEIMLDSIWWKSSEAYSSDEPERPDGEVVVVRLTTLVGDWVVGLLGVMLWCSDSCGDCAT